MALFKIHFQRFGAVKGIAVTNGYISTDKQDEIDKLKKHKLFGSGIELLSADEEAKGSHEPHVTYKEQAKNRIMGIPKTSPFEELFTPHELEQIRSLDSIAKETIKKNVKSILDDRFKKSGEEAENSNTVNPDLDEGEDLSDITDTIKVVPNLKTPIFMQDIEAEQNSQIEKAAINKEVLQEPVKENPIEIKPKPELLDSKNDFELKTILEGLEDENHQPVIVAAGTSRETMIELIKKYEAIRESEIINK